MGSWETRQQQQDEIFVLRKFCEGERRGSLHAKLVKYNGSANRRERRFSFFWGPLCLRPMGVGPDWFGGGRIQLVWLLPSLLFLSDRYCSQIFLLGGFGGRGEGTKTRLTYNWHGCI
jgi:hypothetical protein